MSVLKRNYEINTFETIVDEPCGTALFAEPQNFVLEGYFKFELSDVVLKADGVTIPEIDYELAIDEVYTAKEAAGTGKTLYAEFRIVNAAHTGKALTVSGSNFGTMVDNEEMKRYVDDKVLDVVREVIEISEDTDALNNKTYLVTTTLGGDPVTVTLPSELQDNFDVGVYKITGIDTPEVCVDGNGILIGSIPIQEIVGESEGISIIADGKYFINQDNRGAVQRKLSQSTGVFSGFVITPNVDPTKIDIGPGIYEIEIASDMLHPVSKTVQFDGVVGYAIDNLSIEGITFVFIDVDQVLSQQTNVTTSPEQWRTKARIATVQHFFASGTVENALPYHTPPQNPASRVSTFMNTIGIIRKGVVISGASADNLQLANTSGILVSPGSNQFNNSLSPDNVPISPADPVPVIVYLTQNEVNRLETGPAAVVDVENYGVGGVITLIPGPNATSSIRRVYMGIDGTIAIQYGQNTYPTLASAKDALFSGEDTYVEHPILDGITTLLGYIIARKDATNLNNDTNALFFITDKFGGGGTISGGGAGAATLQEAYDNSITDPEIITNEARKALDIRNGSLSDTNSVVSVQNISGEKILDVTGEKVAALKGAKTGQSGTGNHDAGAVDDSEYISYSGDRADPAYAYENDIAPHSISNPVWEPSTDYASGDTVLVSGELFEYATEGTSGLSEPIKNGANQITDGTATGFFIGVEALVKNINKTVATLETKDGLGIDTYWEARDVDADKFFLFSHRVIILEDVGISFPSVNVAPSGGNVSGTYSANSPKITFMSDADELAIQGRSNFFPNQETMILCDGVLLKAGAWSITEVILSHGCIHITHNSGERTLRKYEVYLSPNNVFFGVYTKSTDVVFAPSEDLRVGFCGDSLIAGSSGGPFVPGRDAVSITCEILKDMTGREISPINLGSGGVGFIADQGGARTNNVDRMTDFTDQDLDVLVIAGAFNDSSQTEVDQKAAFSAFFTAYLAEKPSSKIIVLPSTVGADFAPAVATNGYLKDAVDTFADPRVTFQHLGLLDSTIIYGTGTQAVPTGDGNADFFRYSDGTHPNLAGIQFIAKSYASVLGEHISKLDSPIGIVDGVCVAGTNVVIDNERTHQNEYCTGAGCEFTSSALIALGATILTLQVGFRPYKQQRVSFVEDGGTFVGQAIINTDGTLTVNEDDGFPAGTYSFSKTYPLSQG